MMTLTCKKNVLAIAVSFMSSLAIAQGESNPVSTATTSAPIEKNAAALDQVVAVLENDVILDSEINQATEVVIAKSNAQTLPSAAQLEMIKLDVFRQIALRKLQIALADRLGITVDDAALNEGVLNYARQQNIGSIAELEQAMSAQNAEAYFTLRQQISDEIKISRLRQQQVSARVKVTEKDIDNFLSSPESQLLIQPEYRVIHITIKKSDARRPRSTTAQVAQEIHTSLLNGKAVEDIAKQFSTTTETVNIQMSDWVPIRQFPSLFADQLKTLDKDGVTRVIDSPDKLHIFKVVDRRGGDRSIVDQWKVRHILVTPTENLSANDAKTRIDTIYTSLTQGDDFSQLAKKYSNDPGSARAGGTLGWVSPGEMVPSFEEAIVKTPIGQYSTPFQSPFGWHVLQVQEARKQDMTDLYKRNAARRILFDRKFEQEYENWLREIKNISYINVRVPFYQAAW